MIKMNKKNMKIGSKTIYTNENEINEKRSKDSYAWSI